MPAIPRNQMKYKNRIVVTAFECVCLVKSQAVSETIKLLAKKKYNAMGEEQGAATAHG